MNTNSVVRFLICALSLGNAVAATSVKFVVSEGSVKIDHDGCSVQISLASPRLIFDAGVAPSGLLPSTIRGSLTETGMLELSCPNLTVGGRTLEMTAFLQWSPTEGVLRKWAKFHLRDMDEPLILQEVVLDEIDVSAQEIHLAGASPQSYPAFWRGFFAGIEYPVATTRLEGKQLVLAHRPGLRVQSGVSYETRKAIYGVAAPGKERLAFMDYIAAHRPQPSGLHFNYNSWWTSSVPFTEAEILGLITAFDNSLYKGHATVLDTFAIDLGWSQTKSIWQIDATLFPNGFTRIEDAATNMASRLGLWISPSAFYGPALDTQWAEEQGYETMTMPWFNGTTRLCCLGGPKYSAAFRDRLVEMVTRYGIGHIKLDGYALQCDESDHGHQPGNLATEAIAEGGIRAFEAVRAAAPNTWLEATCFGWNPSPWWLFHVNSVIGTFGDDAPHGRVPCPVYRESYTTARDFFNLQGAALLPIPIAAQEVLGVIHQSPEPFLNDAVTTLLRGHAFVPLYINPKFMDDRRWKQLADVIQWGREHDATLAHTESILPASWRDGKTPSFVNDAPMPREPYGYAHWKELRGLVLLRNPWIAPTTISVPIPDRVPRVALSAVSLYPEVRRYVESVTPGSDLDVRLAPYETLLLSIGPDAAPSAAPDADDAVCVQLDVRTSEQKWVRVEYEHDGSTLGPDWTCLVEKPFRAVRLSATADTEVRSQRAQLLVLLEGTETPPELLLRLDINGEERNLTLISSDAGFAASTIPSAEHWAFYGAELSKGANCISLSINAGACSRISVWIFATKQGVETDKTNELPTPEVVYLDAAKIAECVDVTAISDVVREPAPVERIDGIFLDSVDPESATQGWGKLEHNRSVWEKPLQIAGHRYVRGLGTHSPARIVYALDGTYRRFQAFVGADAATNGTVTFEVWADGRKLWESGRMNRGSAAKPVDVDVSNIRRLELVVGDGGDNIMGDHADWVDAKLLR